MKRLNFVVIVPILLINNAQADVIKPNDVRSQSQFGVGANIENLVNGDQGPAVGLNPDGPPVSGLTHFGLIAAGEPGVLDDEHGINLGGATSVAQWAWINGCGDGGIAGGSPAEDGTDCGVFGDPGVLSTKPLEDEIIEFEFDGAYDVTEIHIWNNNEDGFAPDRGLDEFEILVSTQRTGETFTAVGTTYNITADEGFDPNSAQVVPLVASGVRRVRLLINSIHGPSSENYVGLSEVRFNGTLVTLDAAADGDKDGDVDGHDFLLWQQHLGLGELDNFEVNGNQTFNSTLTATQSEGDYDNNNVVNGDDFSVWESEFGSPMGSLSSASVPEPSSLLLIASALTGQFARRRRHDY